MTKKNYPLILLIVVGVLEFLLITLECVYSYIGYYMAETYLIVPCLLFAGFALGSDLSTSAKRRMLLACLMVTWFLIVQMQRKLTGEGRHPMGTVLLVYLMALPYADVAKDWKGIGLKYVGKLFVAASLVLAGYAVLLLLEMLPSEFREYVVLDGARVGVLRHPNITACYFMIGIVFCVYLWFQTQKKLAKGILVILIAIQFVTMALTNCRTTLLLTCAFFGGTVFFMMKKNNWKKFAAALLVAVAVLAGTFWVSAKIFATHSEMQTAKVAAKLEAGREEEIDQLYFIENGQVVLYTSSGQGTLSNDMRTLNGRTRIWRSALKALRDTPSLAVWGTEYAETVISAYHVFRVGHAHNSWVEVLMRLGAPGLLLSLVFTAMAIRSIVVILWYDYFEIWKKVIAMLTLCLLGTGFLEPYLFITKVNFHIMDFVFFLCLGYLEYWRSVGPAVLEE